MEDPKLTPSYDQDRAVAKRNMNSESFRLVTSLLGKYMDGTLPLRLHCECGRVGCDDIINLTLEQRREALRMFQQDFIVVREHIDEVKGDKVLFNAANYVVVKKPIVDRDYRGKRQ